MIRLLIALFALFALFIPAYAQQDPDDPGMQDSLIIGDVHIDSGQTYAFLPVYAVTDDSVVFYNLPLRWTSPLGGVNPGTGLLYFTPLNYWDTFDSIMTNQNYIRAVGWYDWRWDDGYYMHTNGLRAHYWTVRFVISPAARSQLVVIDTARDDRNYSILLGLNDGMSEITPGFQRGYISIGETEATGGTRPISFSLSQNYPNPFNSSTEIQFSLPSPGKASLVIYDIQGREVRKLFDEDFDAGAHSVIWNGTNNNNQPVSSGIYFYKLIAGDKTQTNRMTLLR